MKTNNVKTDNAKTDDVKTDDLKTDDVKTVGCSTRIKIATVLCAVDLSDGSGHLLDYGSGIAATYGARLYVAHVVPNLDYTLAPRPSAYEEQMEILENAKVELSYLTYCHGARPTQSHLLVEEGRPADVVLEMVQKYGIDLLVMGTHGRRGWHRFALGSVAEEVFRQSTCPVLTVGPRAQTRELIFPLHQLLFATDFSPESCSALPYAFSLAREHQARLTLLHLVHPAIQAPEERRRFEKSYKARLRQLVPDEVECWCDVQFGVEFELPAEGIVRAAAASNADMIILGVRGMGAFAAFETHLPGQTAYGVIADAPCAVLTIRALEV